jgi:hypothetical protein
MTDEEMKEYINGWIEVFLIDWKFYTSYYMLILCIILLLANLFS